jgi:polysaccharide export outer membrane protein
MKVAWEQVPHVAGALALFVAALALSGCESLEPSGSGSGAEAASGKPQEGGEELRVGDLVTVKFSGILNPPRDHEERIKEDGYISLPYVGPIKAAGLTTGQLQTNIRTNYVPALYRDLTVTVTSENRFFYVGGEVRFPSRQVYATRITVLGAINSAGGFTDFANKTNVKLTRINGEIKIVNCKRALKKPELDLEVYPGDRIEVPRRKL